MSVETNANFITDLDDAYPRKNDLIKEGDDHLRLIKRILKNNLPGFNKAVTMTADKLNLLDRGLTADDQAITTATAFKIGTGRGFSANSNKITDLAAGTADNDAVSFKQLRDTIASNAWPVNSIYITADNRNPSEILGYGVWEQFSKGRVLIGAGTTTDSSNSTQTLNLGTSSGEFSHTLRETELPPHSHTHNLATTSNGEHTHTFNYLQMLKPSPDTKHDAEMAQGGRVDYNTSTAGAHVHTITGSISGGGSSTPFTNMQPYIVVAIWKRTS